VFYVSILGTVFAAYLFTYLLTKESEDSIFHATNLKVILVIFVIFCLFLGGVLNLYPSPYNLTPNYQTTWSEVTGMAFIYEHRDVNVPLSGITLAPGRFAYVLLTPEERTVQRLPIYLDQAVAAPWHFGYDRYPSISFVYDEETDLVIKQQDKVIYVNYFPDIAQFRYTNLDFERLNDDSGVALLYSNGGFDYWRVTAVT